MTRPSGNVDKKLLEAAKELLPKTGFTNLSVRMVTKRAGVNLGMFNYHFKTKEAFIEKLLTETYEEFFKKFTLEAQTGKTSLEQFKNAIFAVAVFARDNRHMIAMLIEDVLLGNAKIVEFIRQNMTKHVVILVKLLRKCQKDGYLVKIPLFNILPLIAASIIGPNVIIRLAEKHIATNLKLKFMVKLISTQILSDKAINQRLKVVFKGLAPGGAE
ncbi:MAG: TetR/AcrR family transcriptional regulator [Elusimicrobia bacterium]|nr:TetR/AcrR family transcriptional regulator [Candidatus Liberimonas magnetica]